MKIEKMNVVVVTSAVFLRCAPRILQLKTR
jgi:hypothetical protein